MRYLQEQYIHTHLIWAHVFVWIIFCVNNTYAHYSQGVSKIRLWTLRFDVHSTVRCVKFFIIKPTRCTNFSNLFLEWNSPCFWQFLCPSSGVFYCTHSNGICHTRLLAACEQDQGEHPDPAWELPANLYDIYHCCVYSKKLLMMDRETVRNM